MPVAIAHKVIKLLDHHKRILPDSIPCSQHDYSHCFGEHLEKVVNLVNDNKCIRFVLPAFPAKSPNQSKTAGVLPDKGERLALFFLNELCKSIGEFYEPAAEIVICSDGRVFNDLVNVHDHDVDAYAAEIKNIIIEDKLDKIKLFSLEDCYQQLTYSQMRAKLLYDHGEAMSVLKTKIKSDQKALIQFNGIHRFIFDDNLHLLPALTKNKIRKISKAQTYQVIQRSNAWSVLVEKTFPEAIRLSIHPQICGSNKIGIMLLQCHDTWATPWHRVVLFDGKNHVLIRRKEAERLGANLVLRKDRFSHFELLGSV